MFELEYGQMESQMQFSHSATKNTRKYADIRNNLSKYDIIDLKFLTSQLLNVLDDFLNFDCLESICS